MRLSELVGHKFDVINGNWSGIVSQDGKTNNYILIIPEDDNVININNDNEFINRHYMLSGVRKLNESEYLKILLDYDLVSGGNKESLCIYNDEFYMVEEDALYISKDKEYKNNKQIKILNDKGSKKVNVDDVCFNYQPNYIEKLCLIKDKNISNKMIVNALLYNNRSLKDKIALYNFKVMLNSENYDFNEYILKRVQNEIEQTFDKGWHYSYFKEMMNELEVEKGIYIRGDYDITGSQSRYMYIIKDETLKLLITDDRKQTKRAYYVSCNIDDLKKGFKLIFNRHPKYNLYQLLEHLARIGYFENDEKIYKEDKKLYQSDY